LSRSAPSPQTARPTSLRHVSTLIDQVGCATVRPHEAAEAAQLLGGVDVLARDPARTPPTSTTAAPSATARSTAASAAPGSYVAPGSKNESGVRLTMAMTASSSGPERARASRSVTRAS
jgi:hypothetical protein